MLRQERVQRRRQRACCPGIYWACPSLHGCVQEEGLACALAGSGQCVEIHTLVSNPGYIIGPQGPSRPRNEEEELAVALAMSMEQSRGGAPDSLPSSPVAPRAHTAAQVASLRCSRVCSNASEACLGRSSIVHYILSLPRPG